MSHFPLLIRWTDNGDYQVVSRPENITPGRTFKVIQTCIKVK